MDTEKRKRDQYAEGQRAEELPRGLVQTKLWVPEGHRESDRSIMTGLEAL